MLIFFQSDSPPKSMKQRCASTAFAPVARDGLRVQASSPSKTKWEKHAGQGGIWTLGWGTRWVKRYTFKRRSTIPASQLRPAASAAAASFCTSQWPPSGRPVAAQWPPQWPPSGRPQILVFLIKYKLKKEKARVLCILFLNQNIQNTPLFVGGHWAATGAATGRPLGGHWAATVRWQLPPSEYQRNTY